MEIEYQYRFGLPKTIVTKYIHNEEVLRNSLPGCKSFTKSSTGIYTGEMEINLGLLQDLFTLDVEIVDDKTPSLIKLKINGNGDLGQINGNAILMFKENQGLTQLTCKAAGKVSGTLGLAGKKLLDSGAAKGLENFFQQLEKEMKRKVYQTKRRKR
ncbi:SRPBCC domain-containing protein [Neobacillus vireti]|uniref:SRPBCC domain-containing protein n=1 Tax=Neobacillus vireti TaxID=220686 RepID=UPI002FFEE03A